MNKKKIILTFITIFLFLLIILIGHFLFNRYFLKKNFEEDVLSFANKNENTIFLINKLTLFSTCDVKNKSASITNFTIENLYQYTDIALFITSPLEEKNAENTLKKVWIDNINYTITPSVGEQKLYYKNINNFATNYIIEDNIITDKLEFNITSEDEANLDTPTLYNNLANPIVLSYVNNNIKTDYTLTDTTIPITYDGSLLKKCNVLLNSLNCCISLDLYIINNLNQEFKCTVYVDIPLEADGKTLYDGSVTIKNDTNFIFYRYK